MRGGRRQNNDAAMPSGAHKGAALELRRGSWEERVSGQGKTPATPRTVANKYGR